VIVWLCLTRKKRISGIIEFSNDCAMIFMDRKNYIPERYNCQPPGMEIVGIRAVSFGRKHEGCKELHRQRLQDVSILADKTS